MTDFNIELAIKITLARGVSLEKSIDFIKYPLTSKQYMSIYECACASDMGNLKYIQQHRHNKNLYTIALTKSQKLNSIGLNLEPREITPDHIDAMILRGMIYPLIKLFSPPPPKPKFISASIIIDANNATRAPSAPQYHIHTQSVATAFQNMSESITSAELESAFVLPPKWLTQDVYDAIYNNMRISDYTAYILLRQFPPNMEYNCDARIEIDGSIKLSPYKNRQLLNALLESTEKLASTISTYILRATFDRRSTTRAEVKLLLEHVLSRAGARYRAALANIMFDQYPEYVDLLPPELILYEKIAPLISVRPALMKYLPAFVAEHARSINIDKRYTPITTECEDLSIYATPAFRRAILKSHQYTNITADDVIAMYDWVPNGQSKFCQIVSEYFNDRDYTRGHISAILKIWPELIKIMPLANQTSDICYTLFLRNPAIYNFVADRRQLLEKISWNLRE
jgi:hypothetical protein